MDSSSEVLVEKTDQIATVTLNAPERHNALNVGMSLALQDTMHALSEEPELRCIVLRGTGSKAFSAGADISEFEKWRNNKRRARTYATVLGGALDSVQECIHPTVALIEGLCVGGGFGVAGMCDLRICGTKSRFGVPVKKLGLVESPLELRPLVRKFGPSAMLEILLTGNLLNAEDALRLGLVNQVVPDDAVASTAYDVAASIADGAPLAARWHKKFIYRLLDPTPLSDAEIDEGYDCFDTEDFQRGYHAFLEKRKPTFSGH